MASAVPSENPSMRAISAPRSHRACISDLVTSPSVRIACSRCMRAPSEPPGATVRTDQTKAENGRDQSTSFEVRLAC